MIPGQDYPIDKLKFMATYTTDYNGQTQNLHGIIQVGPDKQVTDLYGVVTIRNNGSDTSNVPDRHAIMRLGGYDNEGILIEPTPMTESYDVYTKTSSYASEHTEVCFEINNGTLKINPSNDDSASEEMCLITPKSAGSIGAVGSQPELWAVPDDSRLGAALAQAATQQLK